MSAHSASCTRSVQSWGRLVHGGPCEAADLHAEDCGTLASWRRGSGATAAGGEGSRGPSLARALRGMDLDSRGPPASSSSAGGPPHEAPNQNRHARSRAAPNRTVASARWRLVLERRVRPYFHILFAWLVPLLLSNLRYKIDRNFSESDLFLRTPAHRWSTFDVGAPPSGSWISRGDASKATHRHAGGLVGRGNCPNSCTTTADRFLGAHIQERRLPTCGSWLFRGGYAWNGWPQLRSHSATSFPAKPRPKHIFHESRLTSLLNSN